MSSLDLVYAGAPGHLFLVVSNTSSERNCSAFVNECAEIQAMTGFMLFAVFMV
jgi:hypothetical protein